MIKEPNMRNFVLLGLLLTFAVPAHAGIDKYTVHVAIHDARTWAGHSDPIYNVASCKSAIARFIRSAKNKRKFQNHFIDFACVDNKSFKILMQQKTKWFRKKVTIEYTTSPLPRLLKLK